MNRHPQIQWVFWQPTTAGFVVRCGACGAQTSVGSPGLVDAFARDHAQHTSPARGHYGAGDLVAGATKALGMQSCTPCEARRHALNQALPKLWRR